MSHLVDHAGQRFGRLVAIEKVAASRSGATRWLCQCDCGQTRVVYATHLTQGNTRSCGCGKPRGKDRKQWTGCGDITGQFWSQILGSATKSKKRQALDFTITIEYAWALYQRQGGRCALTGLPIPLPARFGDEQVASLDRIDSSLGYVPGNVQWLHKDVNRMKNAYDQNYFIRMCRLVVEQADGGPDV